MAERTSDRFAPGVSHRSGDGGNETSGSDDSGITCDNKDANQRSACLGGGEHPHRALEECATRANSAAASAVRNAERMVARVIFILVEPTGHNAPAGSRPASTGRDNCCARTGEPFGRRFSRTIHRLQAQRRMIRQATAARRYAYCRISLSRTASAHNTQIRTSSYPEKDPETRRLIIPL